MCDICLQKDACRQNDAWFKNFRIHPLEIMPRNRIQQIQYLCKYDTLLSRQLILGHGIVAKAGHQKTFKKLFNPLITSLPNFILCTIMRRVLE